MTESQQFKPGERVSWEYGSNTYYGIVEEPSGPAGRKHYDAEGMVLVTPDSPGDRSTGWISGEKLKRA